MLENRLGIRDAVELAREEERVSKRNAVRLFESGALRHLSPGTFAALAEIHRALFGEIYDFAGRMRAVDIAKGDFRFASVLYLGASVEAVERMPQRTFSEIVRKYVEMNVAHPFMEGNGRSMRIWLDQMLSAELGLCVDWSRVDKEEYLAAMRRSPVDAGPIERLLFAARTDRTQDRELFMKGVDHSYHYEGLSVYRARDLADEK